MVVAGGSCVGTVVPVVGEAVGWVVFVIGGAVGSVGSEVLVGVAGLEGRSGEGRGSSSKECLAKFVAPDGRGGITPDLPHDPDLARDGGRGNEPDSEDGVRC